ncbi:MAG: hypothetical protein KAV87_21790, partial [Desulfobacteraceae bacterium]|nr:hypothetical protein [Desulfobacteraceae bacterium]
MSLLAQCGYGRSNKIELGIDAGVIDGVIMSPRDETKQRLERGIQQWRVDYPDSFILFDPQFYVATLTPPRNEPLRDGHLGEYEYYNDNHPLRRTHFTPSRIQQYVEECIGYQHIILGENLSYNISPSILFDDFRDNWSQIALDLGIESAEYHATLSNVRPLLISVTVSESALNSTEALEVFLDAITELDVAGFYLVIRPNASSLVNAIDPLRFSRLMYMCYVLSIVNEYTVIVGYSDWHSFILKSVGVNFTACGWYQNLRQFSLSRFMPAKGGQRPRKRYSSAPLLSCPLISPELQDIYLAGQLENVLTGTEHDSLLTEGPVAGEGNWSDVISCLAHWGSLTKVLEQVDNNMGV